MQFGKVIAANEDQYLFVETVRKSFDINIKNAYEGKCLLREAFRAFESRGERKEEDGANLLFYNGKAYLNGYRLTSTFDNIYLQGKCYQPVKLCDILGFSTEVIESLEVIKFSYELVVEAACNDYYTVRDFWYKARYKSIDDIQSYSNYVIKNSPNWLEVFIDATTDFMIASKILDYSIEKKPFYCEVFEEIVEFAIDVGKRFIESIMNYIDFFSKEDGEYFRNSIEEDYDYLLMPDILTFLKKYSHTEFMVRYQLYQENKKLDGTETIYISSYYDMCRDCEELLASETKKSNKTNVVVASAHSYRGSRTNYRDYSTTNKSLLLIQLDDLSSFRAYWNLDHPVVKKRIQFKRHDYEGMRKPIPGNSSFKKEFTSNNTMSNSKKKMTRSNSFQNDNNSLKKQKIYTNNTPFIKNEAFKQTSSSFTNNIGYSQQNFVSSNGVYNQNVFNNNSYGQQNQNTFNNNFSYGQQNQNAFNNNSYGQQKTTINNNNRTYNQASSFNDNTKYNQQNFVNSNGGICNQNTLNNANISYGQQTSTVNYNDIRTNNQKTFVKEQDKKSQENKKCPKCNNNLVLRNGKFGEFYGCSSYPACKYTKNK